MKLFIYYQWVFIEMMKRFFLFQSKRKLQMPSSEKGGGHIMDHKIKEL